MLLLAGFGLRHIRTVLMKLSSSQDSNQVRMEMLQKAPISLTADFPQFPLPPGPFFSY